MAIILKWSNQNASGNTLNVYRKVGNTITPEDKGTPIATLDSAAVTYTDNTTVPGETYTYLVEVIAPLGTVYSRPTTTANLRRVGPGPNEIITGNSEFGYMGIVPAYEMPNMWDLVSYVGSNAGGYLPNLQWHKFVRKNKVYIVPSVQPTTFLGDNGTWLGGIWVYNGSGIASGIEWNFDTSDAKYAPWKKKRVVTIGDFKFNLRAPRAYPDDWDGVHNVELTKQPDTEVNQLIQSLYQGNVIGNNVGNVARLLPVAQMFTQFICAETLIDYANQPRSTCVMKAIARRSDNFADFTEWTRGCPIDNQYNTGAAEQTLIGWRHGSAPTFWPVLELIEE